MTATLIRHLDAVLRPDPTRTVIRPFLPEDPEPFRVDGQPRALRVIRRIAALSDQAVEAELAIVTDSLALRHAGVPDLLARRYDAVARSLDIDEEPDERRRMLIGAYFSAEYSFEAAALFNPSIVPHPDQVGDGEGGLRFVLSLRGIGEGHLSSVTFRTGTWGASDDALTIDRAGPHGVTPVIEDPDPEVAARVQSEALVQINCTEARDISEVVLFPVLESQNRGIEDLRLVRLEGPDGRESYFGTYTAVSDKGARQELLQTDDFRVFRMHPVAGPVSSGKGMALFPRKIGGAYAALFRHDNENLWFARSDTLIDWDGGTRILEPAQPWEFIQIGNCGSPIEIDEGWLVLTHGVGAVRSYSIGAVLLDRDDPTKVLGRLREPLLHPDDRTWDGYVPNVVYSCGGLVRGRTLLLPYALADDITNFATLSLDRLVAAM